MKTISNFKGSDKSKINFREEIFKSIQDMVGRAVANCKVDCTYQSVIKRITPKGYVILDSSGCERTVQCCIPGLVLKEMQKVWVKEPMGDLKGIHICSVAGNTNNSNGRNRSR